MNDTEKTAKTTVTVIGDDARQTHLARLLSEGGFSVHTAPSRGASPLPSETHGSGCVVLPVKRITEDEIDVCAANADADCAVFAWAPTQALKDEAGRRGWKLVDISEDDALVIGNAQITAEAALSIYMNETDKAVFGSRILVTGFGRVSKRVCAVFSALGADVTVMARSREALAEASLLRLKTADMLDTAARSGALSEKYDALFNTVPARILDTNALGMIEKGTLVVDLASSPYGFDDAEAVRLGLNAFRAPALPAKYAPASAAELIADAVKRYFGIAPRAEGGAL